MNSPLAKKTPLKRSDWTMRSRKNKRPAMDPGLRNLVFLRAGGRCDCCGAPLDPDTWDAHHRKLRKQGGEDSLENLVALRHDHHMLVHAHRADAGARGLIVPPWEDPALVPVRRGNGRLYLPAGRRWQLVTETVQE